MDGSSRHGISSYLEALATMVTEPNPQEFKIRPFRIQDQRIAREIILDGMREHFGALDDSFNRDLDDITHSYLREGHDFVVAEWQGKLVGTGALLLQDAATARLARLSVQAHCRRLGIGRALVDHLLCLARQRGCRVALAETNHDWHDARALYQAAGFQVYAVCIETVHMKLELTSTGVASSDEKLSAT